MSDPDTRRLWLSLSPVKSGKVTISLSPLTPTDLPALAATVLVMGVLPGGKPVKLEIAAADILAAGVRVKV